MTLYKFDISKIVTQLDDIVFEHMKKRDDWLKRGALS